MTKHEERPTVHGGTYEGANLACGNDDCDGAVTVTIPAGPDPVIVRCTTCGDGARYEQLKRGTEIRGGR